MTVFSIPIMKFEKVSNGWKCAMDCHPFRAHYIKLEGTHPTPWMLDHVDCIREDMPEYVELMFHMTKQEGLIEQR